MMTKNYRVHAYCQGRGYECIGEEIAASDDFAEASRIASEHTGANGALIVRTDDDMVHDGERWVDPSELRA